MKLTMRLGPRSYDIILRRGALGRVGQLVNLGRKVLVVTDSGVPQQYLSTVLAQCPHGVPVAVSYTHLDVYKRQHLPHADGGGRRGDGD